MLLLLSPPALSDTPTFGQLQYLFDKMYLEGLSCEQTATFGEMRFHTTCADPPPGLPGGALCETLLTNSCTGGPDPNADGERSFADCDDHDPSFNHYETDVCEDGIDQDCDGVDAACPLDGDGDGVDETTDCDDADATVHPGAAEVCGDAIDQDCNGTDPGCTSGYDLPASSADVTLAGPDYSYGYTLAVDDFDGDGVADLLVGQEWDNGAGTTAGAVWTYASPLVAGTWDGEALAASKTEGIASNAALGYSLSALGDVDADGYADFMAGGVSDGYLFFGPNVPAATSSTYAATPMPCAMSEASATLGGSSLTAACMAPSPQTVTIAPIGGSGLSAAVAEVSVDGGAPYAIEVEDIDGDGTDDLWIAAPYAYGDSYYDGKAWLLTGPVVGEATVSALADATITGDSYDHFGWQVTAEGDIDGDGYIDTAVGAPFAFGDDAWGAIYVFSSAPSGAVDARTAADVRLYNSDEGTYVGSVHNYQRDVHMADVDQDGTDDLVNSGGDHHYLHFGPVSGTVDLAWQYDVRIPGLTQGGTAIADLDDDGWLDLAVSAPFGEAGSYISEPGWVYVFSGAGL